jgi:hypothetical protein
MGSSISAFPVPNFKKKIVIFIIFSSEKFPNTLDLFEFKKLTCRWENLQRQPGGNKVKGKKRKIEE